MKNLLFILSLTFLCFRLGAQDLEGLENMTFETWEAHSQKKNEAASLHNELSNKTGRVADDFVFLEELAPFYHGVASGDPKSDRVIIWTKLTTQNEPTSFTVEWSVATDPEMTNIVSSGTYDTSEEQGMTVKIDVEGLSPNTTYYYQFSYGGQTSLLGRTRTAPTGSVDRLRFAVVSCSNYQHGFFNAYARIAERADLNAVLHLGDYIYEYGTDSDTLGRQHQPQYEITTLEDYRQRHSYYKLDPDLIRMHQQHPMICIWDDHETANNSWLDGAENHDAGEGDWAQRKAWGSQAYFEWMPIREIEDGNYAKIYRTVNYGDMADLIMLDTRLAGREVQLESTDSVGTFAEDRTLLGTEQYEWLVSELSNSDAKWKVLGNQVVFSPLNTLGLIANNDAWDGYPAERQRIHDLLIAEQIDNMVIVTGDIHVGIAADVTLTPDEENYNPETGEGAFAVEMVAASVTSNNIDEINEADPDFLASAALGLNIHGKFANLADHGYFILDLSDEQAQGDWYWMESIRERTDIETQEQSWYTMDGDNFLQQASEAMSSIEDAAPLAGWPDANVGIEGNSDSGIVFLSSYPNPFSEVHQLSFVVEQRKQLNIQLLDLSAKQVLAIHDGQVEPGVFDLKINGTGLAEGVYVLMIDDGESKTSKKLVISR